MRPPTLATVCVLATWACQPAQAPYAPEPAPKAEAPEVPAPRAEAEPVASATNTPEPPAEPPPPSEGDPNVPEQCSSEAPFTRLPKSSRSRLDPALGARTPRWKTVVASGGKFSASIPTGVFSVRQIDGGLLLESGLVVDTPHGVVEPGDESRHWFRGFIVRRPQPLVQTICEGSLYARPRALLAEVKTTPAGQPLPIHISGGAHGYETAEYYVQVSERDTLMLHFDVVGEFVSHAAPKRHQALLGQQQQIIDRIIESLAVEER